MDSIYALDLSEEEFEIVAVDDASTDNTLIVLESYAEKHQNIKIVRHLVNRNLGAARNSGLSVSSGCFISFVDSDDEICPGIIDSIRIMEARNLDMVAMKMDRVSETGDIFREFLLPISNERVFSGIWLLETHPFWNLGGCTNYLYSKNLLERVRYPFVEGAYYEDADYVCKHLLFAERVSYCEKCGYRQFSNSDSITHTFSSKHVLGYALLGTRMLALYEALERKSGSSAQNILEGGSYNIMKAFRNLSRLNSSREIRDFYNLFDSRYNRQLLKGYRKPSYCWTWWTRFGIRHRYWMTLFAGIDSFTRRSFM